MTIVTTQYRYKRPAKKRKPVAELEIPAIVRAADPAKIRRRAVPPQSEAVASDVPAGDQRSATPADEERKSAIVTARRPGAVAIRPGLLPDTPEEHKRRGDAAVALFHEIERKIAAADGRRTSARRISEKLEESLMQ